MSEGAKTQAETSASEEKAAVDGSRTRGGGGASDRASRQIDFSSMKLEKEKRQELESTGTRLQELKDKLELDKAEHQRRVLIEENFESIMSEQRTLRSNSEEGIAHSKSEIERLSADLEEPLAQLNALLKKQKAQIAPYSTSVSNAAADVDRASGNVQNHQAQVDAADKQIAKAEADVQAAVKVRDDALAGIEALQNEINKLSGQGENLDPIKVSAELTRRNQYSTNAAMQLSSAESALNNARSNRLNVANQLSLAQNELANAKSKLANAEAQYDAINQQMKMESKPLRDIVEPLQLGISNNEKNIESLSSTIRTCDAAIQDAVDIHDHPEATEALERSISAGEQQIRETTALYETLTQEHTAAKQAANKVKLMIGGVVALVVIIAIVLVVTGII